MNPELQRNLWLELSSRRVMTMPIVLGLIFAAAVTVEDWTGAEALRWTALWFYYAIVVFWGTRAAAVSIVNEIRERTWDFQRLSSIRPWSMVWSKLLGGAIYQWYGGAICLAVWAVASLETADPPSILLDGAYYMLVGILATTVSLFACLIAVRRRASHTRLDVLIYQFAGLAVIFAAQSFWDLATFGSMAQSIFSPTEHANLINFFGQTVEPSAFYLSSLVVFTGWALWGANQLMRTELQMRNGPWGLIGFIGFLALYAAGLAPTAELTGAPLALRTGFGIIAVGGLTYAVIFLEPKDPVHLRWMAQQAAARRYWAIFQRAPSWMLSYGALTGLVILFFVAGMDIREDAKSMSDIRLAITAGFLFVARDIGIFLFFGLSGKQRGDFAAVVTLFVLYFVTTVITGGALSETMLALFIPISDAPAALRIGAPLAEACIVWFFVFQLLRDDAKRAAEFEGAKS
jgi:hypothetical protein